MDRVSCRSIEESEEISFNDADTLALRSSTVFKSRLQTDHTVQFFNTVDDLKAKVSASLKDIPSDSSIEQHDLIQRLI